VTLRDFYERYGPTVAIAAVFALVMILLPGNAPERTSDLAATGPSAVGSNTVEGGDGAITVPEAGAPVDGAVDAGATGAADATGGGAAGATGAAAPGAARGGAAGGAAGAAAGPAAGGSGGAAGASGGVQLGKGPCRSDARMLGIAKYMPPCLSFTGDNGGDTARGVTGNSIKVIRFVSQTDPATQAILKSTKLADDPPVVTRAFQALFAYSNHHYETYGREVVYEEYQASGPDTNDEAMRADAKRIAEEKKAFAVIAGPKVLGQELAARGVICICTVGLSSQFYKENPPYIFGSLPTADEVALHTGEYIGKRLKGKNAQWAGDEFNPAQGFKNQQRKFGLIYIEGSQGRVDPEGKRIRDAMVRELNKNGVALSAEASYLYDPGRNQADMTTMISRMRAAGVTTVIMVVDPLSPTIITTEASRQQYYPEWFITGTGLSDTSAAGRIYDRNQWSHAFGISPLWVTWTDVRQSEGYREFHHGLPGLQPGDEGVLINIYRAPVQQVFVGIHMAGPKLTPDTFAQGQYNYPKTGGTAAAPLVYVTRDFPTQIKDFTEVWYAVDEPGKDERGEQGSGMMMKVDGGKRYEAGQWPVGDPKVFVREGAIAVSDNPPGGGPLPHEQDGHKHQGKCLSCR
jgi:hypothetical protein